MTCHAIISQPPKVLAKSDPVADALDALRASSATMLPVADARGHFLGVFGYRELIAMLLPSAVRLGDQVGELGFLSDSIEDLKKRLGVLGKESLGKHMGTHRSVRAETPLAEALLLLYRGDSYLPVVDIAGKLVGIVTAADVMSKIAEAG